MSDLQVYRNNRSSFQLQNIYSFVKSVHLNFHLNATWGSGTLKQNVQVKRCNYTSLYIRKSIKDTRGSRVPEKGGLELGGLSSNILLFRRHFNEICKIVETLLLSILILSFSLIFLLTGPVNHISKE